MELVEVNFTTSLGKKKIIELLDVCYIMEHKEIIQICSEIIDSAVKLKTRKMNLC